MSIAITAAVSRDTATLTPESLVLENPRDDEVLVEIAYTGICHTDIKAMQGKQGTAKPAVLGHEGCGTVVAVGGAVTQLSPGDRVILCFASCGACASCHAGKPSYCRHARALNMNAERLDGSTAYEGSDVHSHFFGQSSFATHSLTAARNAVQIPDEVPFAIAGAMGCGVLTGAGSVVNVLQVREGSSFVAFGAGAVGLSGVMAARILGARTIIAVDRFAGRLETALAVGATHVFDAADPELVAKVQEATGGGANYALEAAGHPAALSSALAVLGSRGMVAVAGAAGDIAGTFRWRDLQLRGLTIRGVIEGDVNPAQFVPQLMRWYSEGRFPIDKLSRVYDFADINRAIADAESGTTIKPLLRIGG